MSTSKNNAARKNLIADAAERIGGKVSIVGALDAQEADLKSGLQKHMEEIEANNDNKPAKAKRVNPIDECSKSDLLELAALLAKSQEHLESAKKSLQAAVLRKMNKAIVAKLHQKMR